MPSLNLIDPSENMSKYVWGGDVTTLNTDIIRQYIADFKDKKLEQHLKSAPIPEAHEGVQVLVGKNHDQIVKDETKDVLVKYYAPWCGHCKALAPHWDQIGDDVNDIPDLIIAKFDATENEVSGLEVRGYPTLKWFPKGNKEGIDYDGEREFDGIKKWISENSEVYKAARGEPAQVDAAAAVDKSEEL